MHVEGCIHEDWKESMVLLEAYTLIATTSLENQYIVG